MSVALQKIPYRHQCFPSPDSSGKLCLGTENRIKQKQSPLPWALESQTSCNTQLKAGPLSHGPKSLTYLGNSLLYRKFTVMNQPRRMFSVYRAHLFATKVELGSVFFGLRKCSFSHISIIKNEVSTNNFCISQGHHKWKKVYTMSTNNGDSSRVEIGMSWSR